MSRFDNFCIHSTYKLKQKFNKKKGFSIATKEFSLTAQYFCVTKVRVFVKVSSQMPFKKRFSHCGNSTF